MTLLNWPSTLPRPERDSWQAQFDDPRLKRAGENGPPGYRRKFSGVGRNVSLSVILTRSQKDVFDHFFEVETRFGVGAFMMPDPTTDGWQMLASDGTAMLDGDGTPLLLSALWLCTFGDTMPTETVQGLEFRISFSVVAMP